MRRMPSRHRIPPFARSGCPVRAAWGIRPGFPGLSPCGGQVPYVLLTRAPVAGRCRQACTPAAPRLACVKPVASVHPEPGSNSSLLLSCFLSFKRWCSRTPDNPPEQRHPARDMPSFYLWLEYDRELLFASPVARRAAPVLLFLSYCKPFNVLFPGGSSEPAKNVAKLQTCFELCKFFNRFFSPAFRRPLPGTFRHRGGTSVPESECKGRYFFITLQIFQQKSFLKSCC